MWRASLNLKTGCIDSVRPYTSSYRRSSTVFFTTVRPPAQPNTSTPILVESSPSERCRSAVVTTATGGRGKQNASPSVAEQPEKPIARLAKVLAGCGVASRRACEALIAEGRVRVNGQLITEQGTTVDPLRDRVEVRQPSQPRQGSGQEAAAGGRAKGAAAARDAKQQGQRAGSGGKRQTGVGAAAGAGAAAAAAKEEEGKEEEVWKGVSIRRYQEPDSLCYFAVNKPKGYICSSADVGGRGKLAIELLQPWLAQWRREHKNTSQLPPRLFTVGRLDVASSGLIFITNDGQWAQRVIHPSSGVTKEYVVGLGQPASRPQLRALAAGTEVAGTFISPLEVEVLGDPRRVRVVVQEGKKHEVRELVSAAGLQLLSLRRVRIGGYRLPQDLGVGGYRALSPADLRLVTDAGAQEAASASGQTRQRQQQQQAAQRQAAARRELPAALRGLPAEVVERMRLAGK
ncbi:hypothetical protein Agub_g14478 [Astrephomene gubernaculifera]|uniref:RNA-binding S4 domain-containing protein n=1 Tax=Astrephomene gubernaculifera TaxID=47775 RepID=A0AAD3E1H0_9CHLO|nr:hypothetical protein Agub_g14478 [Astrephomene gubernaculifera]